MQFEHASKISFAIIWLKYEPGIISHKSCNNFELKNTKFIDMNKKIDQTCLLYHGQYENTDNFPQL